MKITPLDPKLAATSAVSDRKPATAGDGATLALPSATVQISAAARAAVESLDGNFDTAKVQRMAQAIRDGTFEVNADAIADKLIANARERLEKTYR